MFSVFQLLFLLSAIAGAAVAINPVTAIGRLILIVIGLALSVLATQMPATERNLRLGRILFAALPAVAAVYFLLTNDWSARIGKLPALDPILRLLDQFQPVHGISLNTNVIGGILAAYLPLQIAALRSARRPTAVVLIGLSLAVLLASLSRGAWIAAAGVAFAALVWRGLGRVSSLPRRRWLWLGAMVLGVAVAAALLAFTGLGRRFVASTLAERGNIWLDSVQLALDYPFTGLGLSGFENVYSAYLLLIHVPFLYYAHNLFLDVWLGQGLLGLAAFVGWIITAVVRGMTGDGGRSGADAATEGSPVLRPPSSVSAWRFAALASLGVIVLHGLTDDPWYGYAGAGLPVALPLLFVPLGLLMRRAPMPSPAPSFARRYAVELRLIGVGLLMFALVFFVRLPEMRAAALVNQAALDQQKAELRIYRFQRNGMQDAVRRDLNLQPEIAEYEAALLIDPANATAHRRLGQIALAKGNLDSACAHFRAAWAGNPANRAARQYMGECAALDGDATAAAEFWRSVDLAQGQLQLRYAWYNDFVADKAHADLISAATNSLK